MAKKNVYSLKTVDGDPVRVEEAWKDANGELLTEKVNKADAQTITGLKTFATLPQSSVTPSDDKDLATKKYSDDLWSTRKAQEEKCYQALKTVTKDFTRTDPVYVRIGEDGEPEIHYTMTQADGASYFANMDLGNATLYVHNLGIITDGRLALAGTTVRKAVADELPSTSLTQGFFAQTWEFNQIGPVSIKIGRGTPSSAMFYLCRRLAEISIDEVGEITNLNRFAYGSALKEFPAWDLSKCEDMESFLEGNGILSAFHAYGMKVSFDLSSAALTHDAILEVFNNLGSGVAEGTTLTLGSAKLALMSDEEKKIATDKGWTLA